MNGANPKTHPRETLTAAVSHHPEGAGLEILHAELPGMARRTMQRHLAALVQEGTLIAQGEHRGRKYRLALPRQAERGEVLPSEGSDELPLSSQGKQVTKLIRRPLSQRIPVGYKPKFLLGYEPNRSAYLPDSARKHLHQLGRTPSAARPAGTYARQIMNRLFVDLSWASSRLEGNTYSRLDTENLLQFGRLAEGKDASEAQMILNHKAAIELLIERAEEIGFNRYTFQNLHALLSENLLANPAASGRLRTIEVGITGTTYQPLSVPQQVEEYFQRFLEKAEAIKDPFEQSFFVMAQLPYLQPFEDMNKRVSRLGANISLIRKNLIPLSFVDVPDRPYIEGMLCIYELNRVDLLRDVFVWAYERSCQRYTVIREALPAPDPFRMKYREALIEVVGQLVRRAKPLDLPSTRALAKPLVPSEDLGPFVAMVVNDLHHLHEGNVARYRLRLTEFRRWHAANRQPARKS